MQNTNIIDQVSDFVRIVEWVTAEESSNGQPVYAIQQVNRFNGRYGVGHFEYDLDKAESRAYRLAEDITIINEGHAEMGVGFDMPTDERIEICGCSYCQNGVQELHIAINRI